MSAAAIAPTVIAPAVIESPCVRTCMVDGRLGLCVGCRRTLPEIARWGAMTPDERRAIMARPPHSPTARPTRRLTRSAIHRMQRLWRHAAAQRPEPAR